MQDVLLTYTYDLVIVACASHLWSYNCFALILAVIIIGEFFACFIFCSITLSLFHALAYQNSDS